MAETPEEALRALPPHPTRDAILRALRAQYVAGLERAAELCDGRAANMEDREALEIAALQLRGAAEGIRELAGARDLRNQSALIAGLERAAEVARTEADEYLRNARACDASGNTFGGSMDTHGASACRRVEARIRELAEQAKREG